MEFFGTQIVQSKVICPKLIGQKYSYCPIKGYIQHWKCVFVTQFVLSKVSCTKLIGQKYSNCPIKNYLQHWKCVFVTQFVQSKVSCTKSSGKSYSNCLIEYYHQHWNVPLLLKLSNQRWFVQSLLDKLLKLSNYKLSPSLECFCYSNCPIKKDLSKTYWPKVFKLSDYKLFVQNCSTNTQ